MTSVNIREKIYFRFMQKAMSNGKSEDEAIREVPNMINEQLEKDLEVEKL